ncbi:MAG: hypothetical protein A3I62_03400 [Betaproteobacteria bacterium RIFCSPLOWO2_02_FULL_62_79]|nr:MAG: hypothetical protein A3I62_03400 [Betaproteobacteria bacterium RIFCSPLOWO2_02_FULL_62_79]
MPLELLQCHAEIGVESRVGRIDRYRPRDKLDCRSEAPSLHFNYAQQVQTIDMIWLLRQYRAIQQLRAGQLPALVMRERLLQARGDR